MTKATKTKTKAKTEVQQESRQKVVREQILDIQSQKERGYVNLALLLYEAYTGKYYVEWEYQDFKTYADVELSTKYRKAMNFVEIGEKVSTLGLPKSRIEEIGWSKLRLLVSVMTKDNMSEWLEKAENQNYRDLDEIVRTQRVENGELEEKPKTTILKLKMSEAETAVIESAIEEGKRLTNCDNSVVALEMICQDWLEFKGATPQLTGLRDHIEYLERVYSCKIEVKDEEELIQDNLIVDTQEVVEEEPKQEEQKKEPEKAPTSKSEAKRKNTQAKSKKKIQKKSEEKETVTGNEDIDDLLGL